MKKIIIIVLVIIFTLGLASNLDVANISVKPQAPIVIPIKTVALISRPSTPIPVLATSIRNITTDGIIQLTNKERIKNNLKPLKPNNLLTLAANNKAKDMIVNNYWSHISPQNKTPWQFISEAGYNYSAAGENLARDFNNNDDIVQAWMKSEGHKANILKPNYTEIGIGLIKGSNLEKETIIVVQMFGKPIK